MLGGNYQWATKEVDDESLVSHGQSAVGNPHSPHQVYYRDEGAANYD